MGERCVYGGGTIKDGHCSCGSVPGSTICNLADRNYPDPDLVQRIEGEIEWLRSEAKEAGDRRDAELASVGCDAIRAEFYAGRYQGFNAAADRLAALLKEKADG